jgi:hypothetical protein
MTARVRLDSSARRLTTGSGLEAYPAISPDGKIIYATQKYSTLPNTQLVALHPVTNAENLVPLNQAADGVFSAPDGTLFFTRLPF